jgi:protein-S-isoprenylcysteine O-methyltransferase Ste14
MASSLLIRLFKSLLGSAFYAALVFLGAGRLHWPRGWIFAGVFIGISVAGSLIVELANPGLLAARAKGMRKDTKPFDRTFYRLFLPLMLLYPLVAGLDVRLAAAPLPDWTIWLGTALFVAGSALGAWTMIVNRYAESTVRIQSEHKVITTGPYALVRHPMYLGTLIGLPATALIPGSAWALLPAALIAIAFVWRTAREDAVLHQELDGYDAYTARTRYRLVPGVW